MASRIKLQESFTEFGGSPNRSSSFVPLGPISKFFKTFFSSKLDPKSPLNNDEKSLATPKGDTIVSTDVFYKDGPASMSRSASMVMPQIELNRKRRYADYEEMDEYPEIGSAFDLYADDCTQKGTKNEDWKIESENQPIIDEVTALFKNIKLDQIIWDINRNTAKYGDCFAELIVNTKKEAEGIKQIKILNPNFIIRVENEYGRLVEFLQEIPEDAGPNYGAFMDISKSKFIKLHKKQIVHFRLSNADPTFYPYGRSIAALAHRSFRSLKMMEDAMLIYRLSRAPERRIFYVDVGGLPTQKAELFMERLKEKFKKEKFFNTGQGTIDARYNPMSADEDFFVPIRGNQGTKIETLPGAQNLGDIDDVKYFRDKILAALKIPKDYLVEKDQSPERKANLSQLDVKFAKAVKRVQKSVEVGLENLAKRHLELKGYPTSLIKELRIRLPEPSDMSVKRKLDVDEQKVRVVQAVQGLQLFPKKTIYKEYYDMSDAEIEQTEKDLEKDMEKQAEQGAAMGMGDPMMGGMGGPPGMPGEVGPGGGPGYGEAGNPGMEGAENASPTKNEAHQILLRNLNRLKNKVLIQEEDLRSTNALNRIILREEAKLLRTGK